MKCINCNEIELTNPKAKFCSDRCKKRYNRDKAKSGQYEYGEFVPITAKALNSLVDKPRRGKDITKFEHLPPDVQATIIRLTTNPDGTIDQQARTNRTAIAIDYQHKFPDKFRCTSVGYPVVSNPIPVRVSKPGDADYRPLCKTTREWMANK